MSIQKIIQESINKNPLEVKEALTEELRNRVAEALSAKMEEVDLDEALKIGSKVRIHAPGKDYHGKIGHVGEIRKHTYGTMAPSYTVDYREPGEEHNRSISLSREKIKLHREEVDLDEAVEVRHDRYMRSHGKKARDSGQGSSQWMFTHKEYGTPDYNDSKEVHTVRGKFADAKKSAQKWAKEHGHHSVYVMESVEQIDELKKSTLASYATKAALSSTLAGNTMGSSKGAGEKTAAAKTISKRLQGIHRATGKLAKEEVELGEAAEKPAHQYYATTQYMRPSEMKMLHDKKKPFATEREAFDHIKKQGGRQDGTIHKVHTATGKIVSLRHVAGGQAGYVSDVGRGDPKHLSELPK